MSKNTSDKPKSNKKGFSQLIIVIGIAIFLIIFALSSIRDRRNLENEIQGTLDYLKSQCISYDAVTASDKSKSLMWLSDEVIEVVRDMERDNTAIDSNYLKNHADGQRLTGIIVTDENNELLCEYNKADSDYYFWKSIIDSKTMSDVSEHEEKVVVERVETNGAIYDFAAVSRRDKPGVVFGYYCQNTGAVRSKYTAVENLLGVYNLDMDGTLIITDGERVYSANDENINGKDVEDCDVISVLDNTKQNGNLLKFSYNGKTYYGGKAKCRDYHLYVYYPMMSAFSQCMNIMLYTLFIIVAFLFIMSAIHQKSNNAHIMEINKQNSIIGAISEIYLITFLVDIKRQVVKVLKSPKEINDMFGHTGNDYHALTQACDLYLDEKYRKAHSEFIDISTIQERLKDRENLSFTYKDIYSKWYQTFIIPREKDAEGNAVSAVLATRDVTEQIEKEHEYNNKLIKSAEEANKANIAKTDFLRRMSHDVRTPINGIRGMLEIANHFPNDMEKQTECRKKIWSASGYLLDLVNDILDMSKLESGEITLENVPFNYNSVVNDVVSMTKVQANERGVTFDVIDNGSIENPNIIGSPLHLRRIYMNIVSNAVKYTPAKGSVTLCTREIKISPNRSEYEFICYDTGIGMSKEFQKHMFEPFTQENSDVRTSYKGTGLGLAITKSLVEKMGGSISVSSEKGRGTTFSVKIPFEINKNAKEDDNSLQTAQESDLIKGVKVLLVEDNDLNMEIAEFILENEGAIVTKAWNGQQAVDIFRESKPGDIDVILMDLMMPELNGIQATKLIRSMNRADASTIPIIAMTANAFKEDMEMSSEAGMNEHLAKPLDSQKIITTIAKYIKK